MPSESKSVREKDGERERELLTDYFSHFCCREKAFSAAVSTVLAVCLAAFFLSFLSADL